MDTITRSDRPRAASQAANTSRTMGIMLARVKWEVRMVIDAITNNDNIIPSRHKRDDIIWDRYMNRPSADTINANMIFT